MKKTVIIAIFLVYLASIVAVQLFGVPATVPDSGVYITKITVTDVNLSNRSEEQDNEVRFMESTQRYWFYFIASESAEGYTREEESLQNNPNRIKIDYVLEPNSASKAYLQYVVDNNSVVVLKDTDELVFLKDGSVNLILKESKADHDAQTTVKISARVGG